MKGKAGLLSVAALCIGLVSYGELNPGVVDSLLGDGELSSAFRNLPDDAASLAKRVFGILGDPKQNFENAMTGFENSAHRANPHSKGHGDYSRIYQMMDMQTILRQLKEIVRETSQYGGDGSVIDRDFQELWYNVR